MIRRSEKLFTLTMAMELTRLRATSQRSRGGNQSFRQLLAGGRPRSQTALGVEASEGIWPWGIGWRYAKRALDSFSVFASPLRAPFGFVLRRLYLDSLLLFSIYFLAICHLSSSAFSSAFKKMSQLQQIWICFLTWHLCSHVWNLFRELAGSAA